RFGGGGFFRGARESRDGMKSVRDIPTLSGTRVLVRAPLNVPLVNGEVANDFRLRRALPTIEFLANAGAKVIVCGHIGRAPEETLAPVYRALGALLPQVSFSSEAVGPVAHAAAEALENGGVLVLENLRRYPGEKGNDPAFARELASLADVFVQDAFDTCHREDASIVGVSKLLPSYAGLLLAEEVAALSEARVPERPALAIIGGAKFETKEPVLNALLERYDHVFVGGALANDFLTAKGYAMGASLVSGAHEDSLRALLASDRIVLPSDVVVAASGADASAGHTRTVDAIGSDEAALDIGPETAAALATLARSSATILWNGPLGNYENGFTAGTKALAEAIAASSARSIVGGGDTVAAIEALGLADQFSFISTGGGAMLDFLTRGTLPGIAVLGKS
ncbi:MAG TPA: phosphoglycerate kinase, partial [Candidatus Paceibacterota bacterium]